ncbi:MAG: hypothetical protein ACJ8I9_01720 [Chthoniobacterales bacterium]
MPRPESRLLQIVPHLPGTREGVGDYALNLARRLRTDHGFTTTFLVNDSAQTREIDGFDVLGPLRNELPAALGAKFSNVILHYVNYGYQTRGVPFHLRHFVAQLRSHIAGKLVTMFHELYASGSPWSSAFWTRPWQVRIARDLIRISDACVVSNEVIAREIRQIQADKTIRVAPILSNFGEPKLNLEEERDPHLWAICGGTALIARSVRALASVHRRIPKWCSPQHVELIGGRSSDDLQKLIEQAPLEFQHYPEISANAASQLLRRCSFGWSDYYGSGKVWPGMIFKSGSFGSCCAHGVVPVFAHDEPPLHLYSDFLPGPFFVTLATTRLPTESHLEQTREQIHRWYHRHASSQVTARLYADALR